MGFSENLKVKISWKGVITLAKSIFKILKDNRNIQSDLLKNLHEFMLQGGFSKSEVDQFICKNYMLSMPELTDKWNLLHPDKKKKEMTFYGQVSVLSNKILHLLNVNSSELESLILCDDKENEVYIRIISFISAFGVSSLPLKERFEFTIYDYIGEYEPVDDYDVSECEKEIQLLKMMDKQNLEAIFSQVDKDKLAYVMRMMRADLIMTNLVEYERKDKSTKEVLKKADGSVSVRKVFNPFINDIKMELCLQFNAAKARKLKVVKNVDDDSNEFGVSSVHSVDEISKTEMENLMSAEKTEANEYGLDISKEQLIMIEEKAKETASTEDMNNFSFELADEYKDFLVGLTIDSDVDELEKWLSSVNTYVLSVALNELRDK